jgi:hypothetical protein
MKHLSVLTKAPELPAKAIEIPEDVIVAVQDIDPLTLALEFLSFYVDAINSGMKEKTTA